MLLRGQLYTKCIMMVNCPGKLLQTDRCAFFKLLDWSSCANTSSQKNAHIFPKKSFFSALENELLIQRFCWISSFFIVGPSQH